MSIVDRIRKRARILCAALLVLFILGIIGLKIYTSDYYKEDTATNTAIENDLAGVMEYYEGEHGMVFFPEDRNLKAVIVFYPGGKVEYTAYKGLMYELSSRGYVCLLPRMPENLAFLRINAVEYMTDEHSQEKEKVENLDWYMAGHSLGGVAAARYLAENEEAGEEPEVHYRGIIMCASYPADDLSGIDGLRMLSVYGSRDGVLSMNKYNASRNNWPQDTTEEVIQGGIHSYFGCYGLQRGDGVPEISDRQQLKEAADIIDNWIAEGKGLE